MCQPSYAESADEIYDDDEVISGSAPSEEASFDHESDDDSFDSDGNVRIFDGVTKADVEFVFPDSSIRRMHDDPLINDH